MAKLALKPAALRLSPAEFDKRWRDGDDQASELLSYPDPAGRQRAAAEALGELLQAADGITGKLQQQYRQQGGALARRSVAVVLAPAASLRASWAELHRLGLTDGEIAAAVRKLPALLTQKWEGEAKQLLAAWLQQELGLSLAELVRRHAGYAGSSVSRLSMRAAFLQRHRPAVWQEFRSGAGSRGTGPLLSLLTDDRRFFPKGGCTKDELQAFEREWLQTPAGRLYGGKPSRKWRT